MKRRWGEVFRLALYRKKQFLVHIVTPSLLVYEDMQKTQQYFFNKSSPPPCIHYSVILTTFNQEHEQNSNTHQCMCFHVYQWLIYTAPYFKSSCSPYPHFLHKVLNLYIVVSMITEFVENITPQMTNAHCICDMSDMNWLTHTFTLFNRTMTVTLTTCHVIYISCESLLGYYTMQAHEFIPMFHIKCCLQFRSLNSVTVYIYCTLKESVPNGAQTECCMLSLVSDSDSECWLPNW